MSITIGSHNFDGPFTDSDHLHNTSGVYVILGRANSGNWNVVDVGETATVRHRVSTHDREPCWRGQGHQVLAAAALYVNETSRMQIERSLRAQYRPPCGER